MQRQTPQRRAILSAVSAAQSPLTAEQVHTEVCSAFPRLALTTVYRSLDAYVDAVIKEMDYVAENFRTRYWIPSISAWYAHHTGTGAAGPAADRDQAAF